MKYGKTLLRSQVPEWSRYYLNYKQLKVLLKGLRQRGPTSESQANKDETSSEINTFHIRLDRELSKIDSFLNSKMTEFSNRFKKITGQRQQYLAQARPSMLSTPVLGFASNDSVDSEAEAVSSSSTSVGDFYISEQTNPRNSFFLDAYTSHIEIAHMVHQQKTLLTALLAIKFQIAQLQQFKDNNYNGIVKILKKADKNLECESQANYLESRAAQFPLIFNNTTQTCLQNAIELADQIQLDLQKTLNFFDPSSADYVAYGAVLLEKHKLLIKILSEDDAKELRPFLSAIENDTNFEGSQSKSKIVEIIFEHACFYCAFSCIEFLLETRLWLLDVRDVDERSIFHKIALFGAFHINSSATNYSELMLSEMLSSQQRKLSIPSLQGSSSIVGQTILNSDNYSPLRYDFGNPSDQSKIFAEKALPPGKDPSQVFQTILKVIKSVGDASRIVTMDIDVFGRRPLHYAALNNYPDLYKTMACYVKDSSPVGISEWWYDLDGCSPLFYAVLKGHTEVLAVILELFPSSVNFPFTTSEQVSQSPLTLASVLGYPKIIRLLLQAGASSLEVNENGETALHVVSRNGYIECTRSLIHESKDKDLLLNLKESNSGHTALMLAAMEGHENVCKLLIEAGADLRMEDKKKWRAYDYAILNGFIPMSELLSNKNPKELPEYPSPGSSRTLSPKKMTSKYDALTNECALVITLGSNDTRAPVDPVVFFPEADLFTELHNLKLVVSSNNFSQCLAQIDLPSRGESPIVIRAAPQAVHHLTFDIVPSSPSQGLIARGAWRLDNIAAPRVNHAVPLLKAQTMEIVGHVHFEWIFVSPFEHPQLQLPSGSRETSLPSSTRVIGHRGMGANKPVAGGAKLQVGENTMLSFTTAAALGAEYVEFDVQVTRDHIPVIYHDFTVTESGYDAPMHTLTHQQFLHIYNKVHKLKSPTSPPHSIRRRSNSLNVTNISTPDDHVLVRVKGNNSNTIQSPFVTLAATFTEVPAHIGFNMEVKYPMVDEAEEAGFRGSEMEINTFVDSVLKVVGDAPQGRSLMFSSFHPEICLLLNLKQSRFPVFFLSDCGFTRMADFRCNSLRAAVRFASSHRLAGLVVLADPLLRAPCLMSLIRDAGLACFTYGNANNCLVNVQRQKAIGIDAVIVDSVAAVSKSLKELALV